jgi:hypothetical protein
MGSRGEGPRIAVSSVIRRAGLARPSGFLRVIDLGLKRVLLNAPIRESAFRQYNPNPRGGLRGAKGVDVHEDRLVLANVDRLFVLDRSWRSVGEFSHPWTADIHDVLAEDEGIWVTCTLCDLLLKFDWSGEPIDSWQWREDRALARRFSYRLLPSFDPDLDYRDPRRLAAGGRETVGIFDIVHLNAITRCRDGLLVSFGRMIPRDDVLKQRVRASLRRGHEAVGRTEEAPRVSRRAASTTDQLGAAVPRRGTWSSSILRIRQTNGLPLARAGSPEVLLECNGLAVPNHNALEANGLIVFNDTNQGRVVAHDPATGTVSAAANLPGKRSFARGLARIGPQLFLVGSQAPAVVHTVDLSRGEVTSSFPLSREPAECVFAIAVLPDSFDDPPARLSL